MVSKTTTIGISNRNAPNIYRKCKVADHLFPYDKEHLETSFWEARLTERLEAFSTLVMHRLGIPATHKMSSEEACVCANILGVNKRLYQLLISSTEARKIIANLSADERQLYLCRNYIVELNEEIAQLSNVAVFQICCNYLRMLPPGIGQLKNLKMLILSRNRLVALPAEIGLCRELREIDVSFNLLRELPKAIAGLRNLNTLHLAGNRFNKLPSFLGKLSSLKYLNISHNPITHIPLEVFKLPFLLSLTADNCPFFIKQRWAEVGELSLREIVARHIIKNNLPVSRSILAPDRNFLLRVQECSFCGGPFFDYFIEIEDTHNFEATTYPVRYKMCCGHYNGHDSRLRALFKGKLSTTPFRLIQENMPSVTELFESFCFTPTQTKIMEDGYFSASQMIPLISLAKYKNENFDISKRLSLSADNLNIHEDSLHE